MFNWFIIIVVILVLIVLSKVSHMKHAKHKWVLILTIVVVGFLIVSIYFVSKANNVDMTTMEGFSTGMKIYAGWAIASFNNINSLTGYAVGLDWNPRNKSLNLSNDTKVIGDNVANVTGAGVQKVKANTPKLITNYR
jgi:hypothetical protein